MASKLKPLDVKKNRPGKFCASWQRSARAHVSERNVAKPTFARTTTSEKRQPPILLLTVTREAPVRLFPA